jgi:hypothetical protein
MQDQITTGTQTPASNINRVARGVTISGASKEEILANLNKTLIEMESEIEPGGEISYFLLAEPRLSVVYSGK